MNLLSIKHFAGLVCKLASPDGAIDLQVNGYAALKFNQGDLNSEAINEYYQWMNPDNKGWI